MTSTTSCSHSRLILSVSGFPAKQPLESQQEPPPMSRFVLKAKHLLTLFLLTAGLLHSSSVHAQSLAGSSLPSLPSSAVVLPNHHPQWANPANDLGPLAPDTLVNALTLVLARSPQQEQAFRQFLADQQNPASPSYHRWLTPAQVGNRFGPPHADLAAVTTWLESNGLHVTWTAPSRMFLGFSGTSADLARTFHTELHTYRVNGTEHISVSSDPLVPASLARHIQAIRGLSTIEDKPLHHAATVHAVPEVTTGGGSHYLAPQDFATIYDIPSTDTGNGQTIGIVGRSRTNFADFDQFRQKTGTTFANPAEIIPTAFGGIDPGPAQTAPSASGPSDDQLEATLDVTRAASIATNAQVLLVVTTQAGGDIGADTQYLVQTNPIPAQIINISFGACESSQGRSGVNYWDALFQQAASEGISVFVASGDAGAAGCDAYFSTPTANPPAISPNYICSSSYATCVGGTEFYDAGNTSIYWNPSNSAGLGSAIQYIPEGAWNEPLDGSSAPQAAASGGGVSSFVPTPAWQTGAGVPAARTGRYTPDLAFSSSGHDGYFACFAAAGASCVTSNGGFSFEYFFGTSAAAPDMAGITALVNEQQGAAQGNINAALYNLATSAPGVFHDVTVASSGVTSCSVSTPSMCNNSIPGPTGLTGGEAGYLVNDGYDEVTGLGSLDVANFLTSFATSGKVLPTVSATTTTNAFNTLQVIQVSISVTSPTAGAAAPSGTVTLSSGQYSSAATNLSSGNASITIPAGKLAVGSDTVTVRYSGDTLNDPASTTITLTIAEPFSLTGTAVSVAAGAITGNTSTITVAPADGFTGTVSLTAALASGPTGAVHPPTFSFGSTGKVAITNASSGTATLTISTTAPQSGCPPVAQAQPATPWFAAGGTALACLLFFAVPSARRWRSRLLLLVLFGAMATGLVACGSKSTSTCNVILPGTTPGTYTITVTGVSGTTKETTTVSLTVQ